MVYPLISNPNLEPNHPNTLRVIVRLGRTLSLQKEFKEVREILLDVLERQGQVFREKSREVWITCEKISLCLRDIGQVNKVKVYFRQA